MASELIDVSGEEPMLAEERISVLDIYDVVEAEDRGIDSVCEMWELDSEQVHAALEYYEHHKEEMEAVRHQQEEHLNDILKAQTAQK